MISGKDGGTFWGFDIDSFELELESVSFISLALICEVTLFFDLDFWWRPIANF